MYSYVKRLMDVIVSLVAIIILLPFLLIISLIILFNSGFPVLYLQERVGLDWKIFKIYKFRTMIKNADKIGPGITPGNDSRVTPEGQFLRKYKLDELPQFFNVLFGSMSLVGPRPEIMKYAVIYKNEFSKVLSIKPGITDFASIKYRNEAEILDKVEDQENFYIKEILPERISLSCKYINEFSLITDLKILFVTFITIIR